VRWQRAVKLNVSEKAFRFSADAQGRCPASGLADAVRQPTASSAWRSSRLVFLLLNASATCGLFFCVAFAMCSSNLRGLLARTGCDSACWTSFCPAPPSTRYPRLAFASDGLSVRCSNPPGSLYERAQCGTKALLATVMARCTSATALSSGSTYPAPAITGPAPCREPRSTVPQPERRQAAPS
jgi:hypothetical protein